MRRCVPFLHKHFAKCVRASLHLQVTRCICITSQVTGDASSTLLAEKGGMEEEGLPDHNDFGGGNFLEDLGGLGGLEGLGEVPSVGDITMDAGHTRDDASSPREHCGIPVVYGAQINVNLEFACCAHQCSLEWVLCFVWADQRHHQCFIRHKRTLLLM